MRLFNEDIKLSHMILFIMWLTRLIKHFCQLSAAKNLAT